MDNCIIKFSDVAVGYSTVTILKDVSFSVCAGEVIGLSGPNGCGKSTLLKCLIGQADIIKGDVFISGEKLVKRKTDETVRKYQIAYLPQLDRGVNNLTVYENLLLAAWREANGKSKKAALESILSKPLFNKLKVMLYKKATLLSGGQRLLLALAMMLLQKAIIYLMDEPSSGVDDQSIYHLDELIKEIVRDGSCLIVAEHNDVLLSSCVNKYIKM